MFICRARYVFRRLMYTRSRAVTRFGSLSETGTSEQNPKKQESRLHQPTGTPTKFGDDAACSAPGLPTAARAVLVACGEADHGTDAVSPGADPRNQSKRLSMLAG